MLAGGLGTRLRERVPNLPKPMAPVAGRPFLEYLLDSLHSSGCTEVVLAVGHLWQIIEAHFGSRYRGLELRYAVEDVPLGTGGAVAWGAVQFADKSEDLLVLNGDTFLDVDFARVFDFHRAASSLLTMVLRRVDDTARYGAVIVENGCVSRFAEKGVSGPGLINAGTYVLNPLIFSRFGLKGSFSMEFDLLQRHCAVLRPAAFVTQGNFIDIGLPEDFERAQAALPEWTS